jgi:phenylpropionate dioxygenase-like ring-hydroxylating dioxygenase large terminal subunit
MTQQPDPFMANQWYPIAAIRETAIGKDYSTLLFERRLTYTHLQSGDFRVLCDGTELPVTTRYGYVWTSIGEPDGPVFDIPEYDEDGRRNVQGGTIGVHVSAPRAIENFLDMGHFPYVHTGVLGALPHTEVKEYNVNVSEDGKEIWATECLFYQPMASTVSTQGADVDYTYRVPHPTCSVLYKSSPMDETRMDVISILCQPTGPETMRGHMMLSVLDDQNADSFIRYFQQHIFGQDKPILENQYPKRLPLDPRAETPIRADKSAITYRRWLSQNGATYGVIPAAGNVGHAA